MNTYEVRTQDGGGLLGMFTGNKAEALYDLATGTVSLTEVGDDLETPMATAIQVDPLLPRPLVLVILDEQYQEVHREEVPEQGELPEGVTAGVEPEDG